MGGSANFRHGVEYSLCHCFRICQYLIVPESQNAIALYLEPTCALLVVVSLCRMLPAIHFDDQSALETNKINDKRADRLLATKLYSRDLTTLEFLPQTLFRVRQILAQFPCMYVSHCPHPGLPPQGGKVKVAFRLWNDASRAQSLEQLDEHLFRIHAPVETGLPQLQSIGHDVVARREHKVAV